MSVIWPAFSGHWQYNRKPNFIMHNTYSYVLKRYQIGFFCQSLLFDGLIRTWPTPWYISARARMIKYQTFRTFLWRSRRPGQKYNRSEDSHIFCKIFQFWLQSCLIKVHQIYFIWSKVLSNKALVSELPKMCWYQCCRWR